MEHLGGARSGAPANTSALAHAHTPALTPEHAAGRAPVQLVDGRTGVLVWVPGRTHCGKGNKAKVLLDNNRYLSVAIDDLKVIGKMPA